MATQWTETSIQEINVRKPSGIEPAKFPDETFELYSVPSFDAREPEIVKGSSIGSTKQMVDVGDVLVCKINPRINRVWVVGNRTRYRKIASSEWIVVNTAGTIDPHYLRYEFSAPFFRKLLESEVSGVGGSLTRARPKLVEKYRFPLAPASEQKRIVAKLDTLFAHLDELRSRLDKIPVLLKQFRQAVLTQAVTGKLTEEWRKRNSASKWEPVTINDVLLSLDQGWSPKCESYPARSVEQWGVIKTTAVQEMCFNEAENKQLPSKLRPRPSLEILQGDVLITRAGPRIRVGICCHVRATRKRLMICDKIYRLRLDQSKVFPGYIELLINCPDRVKEIDILKTGISDSGLNLTQSKIRNLRFNKPSLREQVEIINRVETVFAVTNHVEARYVTLRRAVEGLNSSILSKTFE